MRCDKGDPCSTCVKYGNAVCEYSKDLIFAPQTSLESVERYGAVAEPYARSSTGTRLDPALARPGAPGPTPPSAAVSDNGLHVSKFSGASHLGNGPYHTPEMRTQLQLLEEKILMLEKSVSLGRPGREAPRLRAALPDAEPFSFHCAFLPFTAFKGRPPQFVPPLLWIALIRSDNALCHLLFYNWKRNLTRAAIFGLLQNASEPSDRVFIDRFAQEASIAGTADLQAKDRGARLHKYYEKAKATGLTVFEGDLSDSLALSERFLLVLPPRMAVWMLIDRFFARVYVFFPFLDQADFEEHISRILGSDSRADEPITTLNIRRKLDYVHLGLLVVVLRFGYLSLFTNSDAVNLHRLNAAPESREATDLKYLLNNPIHVDVIDLSNESLALCGFLRYNNVSMLQLCLYLKLYYMFAPENCDSPDDTNAKGNTALVINTAISLGLHREVSQFALAVRDAKTAHLCRKIWYFLLIIDVTESMSSGLPPATDRDMFDTTVPLYVAGSENVRDAEVEKEAVFILQRLERCYDPLYKVVRSVSQIRQPPSILSYRTLITDFETQYLLPMKPSFSDKELLSPAQIVEIKVYLQSSFFLLSIMTLFFNYYERLGDLDLAYYYFKKVLSIVIDDMMPLFSDYVDKSLSWYKHSTDIAITPVLQNLAHKCFIVLLAVLVRARFSILGCETLHNHRQNMLYNSKYKVRYELLIELHAIAYQCFDIFTDTSAHLSSRYYYSWRSFKTQDKLKSARDGREFYLEWCRGKEGPFKFESETLIDIIHSMKKALSTIQSKITAKEELRPNESTDYFQDGKSPGPTVNFPYSVPDAAVDDWWMLMLSVKPSLVNNSLYNGQSPDNSLQNLDMGLFSEDFNMMIFDGSYGNGTA